MRELWWATGALIVVGLLVFSHWFAIQWGSKARKRMLRQVHRKRENGSVNDFVIRPAEDGFMEIMITKKCYKKLRGEPLIGIVEGRKDSMAFRLGVL